MSTQKLRRLKGKTTNACSWIRGRVPNFFIKKNNLRKKQKNIEVIVRTTLDYNLTSPVIAIYNAGVSEVYNEYSHNFYQTYLVNLPINKIKLIEN